MARQKKSRKVGKIGISKTPSNVRKPTEKRSKKHLGKPAGSRNNEAQTVNQDSKKINKDPRHGSKKPVSLIAETKAQKSAAKTVKYFSPNQELAAIEQDPRLATLLDKIDLGKKIAREDQHYVNQTLARHKVLCEMLGLTEESEKPIKSSEQQTDLYSQFESININDFKD
ncbi:Der GTPase-activating protein YihI [Paraglaciecola sp. MB-3u-78]|jgi:ribosome assembly protein YihI (activator of Der GTPase)|uniref:Der GTPase-activating protein YihI n=1 Tax=Paraglaciecola sp. MB-3u-78 TaxID=2058332 RepID=UPI000C31B924|nr:Der GTPase-activating protein YihI [Paraglaciecola sp. MB-3u-78]PKG97916.1 GTPase-activating protein [Paraglaciecola sp. MB-3u-78]